MTRHNPAERYLPAILDLELAGVVPIRARLADRFDVSPATVSGNVRRLEISGYVCVGDDRVIRLTGNGRALATTLLDNMRVAERLLAALGVDDASVRVDAEQWALVMSDDVAEALADLLDEGTSCPFDHRSVPDEPAPDEGFEFTG